MITMVIISGTLCTLVCSLYMVYHCLVNVSGNTLRCYYVCDCVADSFREVSGHSERQWT